MSNKLNKLATSREEFEKKIDRVSGWLIRKILFDFDSQISEGYTRALLRKIAREAALHPEWFINV